MTECQGCGAWNDAARIVCVLCGTPLAETDEWDATADLPPLPPLPDGGLSASMPAWLREAPAAWSALDAAATPEPALAELAHTRHAVTGDALDSRADPRTFLTDEDFPHWLRALAARQTTAAEPSPAARPAATRLPATPHSATPPAAADGATPVAAPAPSAPATKGAAAPATIPGKEASPPSVPQAPPAPASLPAGTRNGRGARSAWETLLLIILVLAVIGAALWALASNGVLGTGL